MATGQNNLFTRIQPLGGNSAPHKADFGKQGTADTPHITTRVTVIKRKFFLFKKEK